VKRELTVKGNTPGEKINSVEAILRRMSRKMSSKIIGVLPASPVFDFVYVPDSEGVVMRRLFPVSGLITKAGIAFDVRGKKPIKLIFSVENDIEMRSFSNSFIIKKTAEVLDLNFEVVAGDKITLTVELEKDEEVTGIWVGFLYEIALKNLNKKEFLLEELNNMIEEETKGLDEES